ncbi:protein of unknown function [Tenacibaculum sp. 190524A02b]|uniref:hypothetical protein n=1 Tax=Tenacibaculum vairaonense TaxID=3137860 RepID=UPI0032B12CB1
MEASVRNLYKEAVKNKDFDKEMKSQDPKGYYKPNLLSSKRVKIAYTAAYYGWLLGKGKYNRMNYI